MFVQQTFYELSILPSLQYLKIYTLFSLHIHIFTCILQLIVYLNLKIQKLNVSSGYHTEQGTSKFFLSNSKVERHTAFEFKHQY